jgi:hypothetical protein
MNACMRTCAVAPSGKGVSDQVFGTPPVNVARIVSPMICALATSVPCPTHVCVMVVSAGSTVRTVSCDPVGKAGIVPTQLPAKRLRTLALGCVLGAEGNLCVFDVIWALSLTILGAGFLTFGLTFADGSGAGVCFSSSTIGAGKRCAVIKSTKTMSKS